NFTLGVANTYTGGTTITGGTVTTLNTASLGTSTVTLNGGTLFLSAAALAQVQLSGTGWNADVVHALADPATTPFGTTSDVDAGVPPNIFYEVGVNTGAPTSGLPSNLTVTNPADGIVFKLQPYSGPNEIRVTPGGTVALSGITNGAGLVALYI